VICGCHLLVDDHAEHRESRNTLYIHTWRRDKCLPFAQKTISFVLVQFSHKLFFSAHSLMCASSATLVPQFTAGTIKYVSSANLIQLPPLTGQRSAAVTKYDAGPSPDPWITLAWMLGSVDISLLYFVQCVWPSNKFLIQLKQNTLVYYYVRIFQKIEYAYDTLCLLAWIHIDLFKT